VRRTVELHAWVLLALLAGVAALAVLILVLWRVHEGDLAYIARARLPSSRPDLG
jgi:hypothetical protein